MKKTLLSLFALLSVSLLAQPGKDAALTISSPNQVVNRYCPLSANISAGSSTLSVANGTFASICPGELILVYQAQGASINTTNTPQYSDVTNYNSAGFYEFKYVQSVTGNIITVQTTFTNSYQLAGKPQVVRVPQYTTLPINAGASIVAKEWKDTTMAGVPYRFGGLVVIHAMNLGCDLRNSWWGIAAVFCMLLINVSNISVRACRLLEDELVFTFHIFPGFHLPVDEARANVIGICIIHLHLKFMKDSFLALKRDPDPSFPFFLCKLKHHLNILLGLVMIGHVNVLQNNAVILCRKMNKQAKPRHIFAQRG